MPVMPPLFRPSGRTRKDVRREADARRGSAHQRGYGFKWDKAAKRFRRSNPLCLGCQAAGRTMAAEVTDHIIPHKGDMELFWNADNWQASCRWHHDVIKQRLEDAWSEGKIGADDLRLDSAAAIRLTREHSIA